MDENMQVFSLFCIKRDLDGGTYSKNLKFQTAKAFKRSIMQNFDCDS